MNNLKKIGLTALAASLVTTSAFAGALSVSGGASIGVKNTTGTNDPSTGKGFTMGNQITFSGSGELDNGLNVALSFVIDESDGDTSTTSGPANGSIFDAHSVTISSDALGSFKFSGEGGSSAQGAIDAGAAGDLWNNGTGVSEIAGAAAGDNSMFYTLPEMMSGVAITASMSPGAAAGPTHTSYAVAYTGVEGLTLKFGQGDAGEPAKKIESTTMMASYAISSFTVSASHSSADKLAANNREVTAYQVAYTVSDDLSVTYGTEEYNTATKPINEEIDSWGVSYTTGGMTLSANTFETTGAGNAAAAKTERWALGLSFAF
ncbi:porin [Candidatus Pelagibacter ubique]|nr:porin [Candidatus Pelagibacter ubique]